MKITLITCPFGALPPIATGAVEKLFYLLAGEWAERGHKVTFICAGGGDNDQIDFIRLKKYNRTGTTKNDLIWDFVFSIKALFFCPKTDILLCNTFWSPFLAPLMWWKYKRLVYGVHRFPKGQFFLYPFVHKFICVSTAVSAALGKELGDDKRVTTINNPIDTTVYRKMADNENDDFIVAYAGRIHPEKGLHILFKACEMMAQEDNCSIKLRLFGESSVAAGGGGDEYVSTLMRLAPHVNVKFMGAISSPIALAAQLRKCSVFVYPSVAVKGETFGVAPLEAMGLGLPTVLSNLSCFCDYAKEEENCLCFCVGDKEVDGCLRALRRIRDDQFLRIKLGSNAAETAQRFSTSRIASEYIGQFENMIK